VKPFRQLILTAGLMVAAALAACGDRPGGTGEPGAAVPATASEEPNPHAPALRYTPDPEWIAETPASSMRQAQYRLPRAEGDSEDAELAVFFFSGQGGTVQDNIDRWIGQFQKNDGSPAAGAITTREVRGIPLTIVDVSGIYISSSGMMLEQTKAKPNFRMVAAVAETSAGPWFFKLTGPAKTVARWEPGFQSFLDTLH
jgi:hypothetical protein